MRDMLAGLVGLLMLMAAAPAAATQGAHAFTLEAIEGGPLPLAQWQGRPILVVNTASFCGFTNQYAGLQDLWQRYRERGLVVLGVPSNDFHQETGTSTDIKTFCEVNFAVDFPLADKTHVRGPDSHPLFAWLRAELGEGAGPKWNFYKFLIGPDGRAVAAWPSQVHPEAREITQAIEALLPAS